MNENMTPAVNKKRPNLIGGMILVLIGVLSLLSNFFGDTPYALWFLPALGVIFLAAGIIAAKRGLLIPGGIILGIGAGAMALEQYFPNMAEPAKGGIFMVAFACGWALITLLSLFVKDAEDKSKVMWWPLIPGGIIGVIGAALLMGESGLKVLDYFGQGWPVILIAIGLYLILRRRDIQEK
jgi:hypothetical protein